VTTFILRRTLATIPVLLGILFLVFVLARVIPGDPCTAVLGEHATVPMCNLWIREHGLDQPIPAQFALYLGQIFQGDFGDSLRLGRPVTTVLIERLPTTVELTLFAITIAVVVGIPLGMLSAVKRNSAADVGTMMFANLGVSIPVFVLGLVLAYFFAVVLKGTPFALPPSGRLSSGVEVIPLAVVWHLESWTGVPRAILDFVSGLYVFSSLISGQWGAAGDAFRHLLLPAAALATIPLAIIARITRSSLLDTLGQDYVRTARAKGARERTVVLRHAVRNALLPIVTIIGLQLGGLLSGAVLTETVFNLAGVGRTLYEAITGRDYVVIQGFTLVIAVIYVLVNLAVDISYGFLDPRIRQR
jgi:peptide/nickel transport system permease protein